MIRIVLANDHPIVRGSLRLLLEREPDFRIVGEAANGREAVVLTEYTRPDVVLLDIQLGHLGGIAAAREISSRSKESRIVFVTMLTDEEYVLEARKAGASGYVLGNSAQTDLVSAVRTVSSGGCFLSPEITSHRETG
jgi:DNA-binding NarL/FixJ family response regulator